MAVHPISELMAPDWAQALAGQEQQIHAMGEFLRAEIAAGRGYLPDGDRVLRAFSRPLADVRVLIVGQDPYPTPGHPIGLRVAVGRVVRPLPKSLANIYLEQGLGAGHRRRHRRPRRPRRPARGDPVGTRRPVAGPDAHRRRDPRDRVVPSEPAVGPLGFLRLATLQPGEPGARRGRGPAHRLGPERTLRRAWDRGSGAGRRAGTRRSARERSRAPQRRRRGARRPSGTGRAHPTAAMSESSRASSSPARRSFGTKPFSVISAKMLIDSWARMALASKLPKICRQCSTARTAPSAP